MPRPALHHIQACHAEVYAVLATKDGPKFYRVLNIAAYSVGVKDTEISEPYESKVPAALIALDENEHAPDGVGHIEAADFLRNHIGFHNGSIAAPGSEKWTYWLECAAGRWAELEAEDAAAKQSPIWKPNTKPLIVN